MNLKVYLEKGAMVPTKAHDLDAGFDLYTPKTVLVKAKDVAVIDTGVHIEIPAGYVGVIKSKSGLNIKCGLQSEGVIDAGYTGSIVVKLYNNSYEPHLFVEGEKITQLLILPIADVKKLILVDSFEKFSQSERGENGFGSSGK